MSSTDSEEKKLLDKAKTDVECLVDDTVEKIYQLANHYHYETDWVMEEFKKQFAGRI